MSRSSRENNVPPRAPLKMQKDSRKIRKQSSSSSSSSTTTSSTPRRPPVIIYTKSPRIIHTPASNFKELVQKLTGLPQSTDDDDSAAATNDPPPAPSNIPWKDADTMHAANNDSSSSSENPDSKKDSTE